MVFMNRCYSVSYDNLNTGCFLNDEVVNSRIGDWRVVPDRYWFRIWFLGMLFHK